MSQPLISRSDDLRRLQEDGYEVAVRGGFLLIGHVPYVTPTREVAHGTMVSTLTLAGDITAQPDTHVAMFAGQMPCDRDGQPLRQIDTGIGHQAIGEGIEVDHTFSSKPASGSYVDYYEKMTTYVNIVAGPARSLDPEATAQTFQVIETSGPDSVFAYEENASSRAGIAAATAKLRIGKVAIVGLGGTGSYILDLIAKTPIGEIHLFDGDVLLQHNGFRAPGAPSLEELREKPPKVEYFQQRYTKMRRSIVAHADHVDETNIESLREMDFVFLCLDDGPARRLLVEHLERWGASFIDVGMGVWETEGALGGQVRVTTSTPEKQDHVWERGRIPFGPPDPENEYRQNIQIAELNMLNAALAVIRWKKLAGFYLDLEHEHFSVYEIDGNDILNEDQL